MVVMKIKLSKDSVGAIYAEFVEGLNSVSQNNAGNNVVKVVLDGFELSESEVLRIAFSTSENEDDTEMENVGFTIMAWNPDENDYSLLIDPIVLKTRGIWYLDLQIASGWNSVLNDFSMKLHILEKLEFQVRNTLYDATGTSPNVGDIAALYTEAVRKIKTETTNGQELEKLKKTLADDIKPNLQTLNSEKVSKAGDEMTGPLRVSSSRSLSKAQLQNDGLEVGTLDKQYPDKTWYANGFIIRTKDGKEIAVELPDVPGTLMTADGIAALRKAVEEASSIAKGANQSLSYGDYATLIATLNALPNTALNVGQNLYIFTVGVPDLWVAEIVEEAVEYAYTTDEDFVNELKANDFVQVGHYKIAQLETQEASITDCIKATDIPNEERAAGVKYGTGYGIYLTKDALIKTAPAQKSTIDAKANTYEPITPKWLEYAVMKALTELKTNYGEGVEVWTDDTTDETTGEVVQGTKPKARETLGAVGFTDYATEDKAGVVKISGLDYGLELYNGTLRIRPPNDWNIVYGRKNASNSPVTLEKADKVVKEVMINPRVEMTDDTTDEEGNVVKGEKTKACEWLGALKEKSAIAPTEGGYYVYVIDRNGKNILLEANYYNRFGLAVRSSTGDIMVPTPNADTYEGFAVNRRYVDNLPNYLTLTGDTTAADGTVTEGTRTKWQKWLGVSSGGGVVKRMVSTERQITNADRIYILSAEWDYCEGFGIDLMKLNATLPKGRNLDLSMLNSSLASELHFEENGELWIKKYNEDNVDTFIIFYLEF